MAGWEGQTSVFLKIQTKFTVLFGPKILHLILYHNMHNMLETYIHRGQKKASLLPMQSKV